MQARGTHINVRKPHKVSFHAMGPLNEPTSLLVFFLTGFQVGLNSAPICLFLSLSLYQQLTSVRLTTLIATSSSL